MLTNGFLAELDPRCFTNTLEKVCTLVAFYLYINQKTQFDRDTFKFVVLLTIGFMMRNTFPIGWIPLLLVLVVKADKPVIYIIQCVFTFLPFFVLFVTIDSIYYWQANGGELEVTFTGYNFLKVNVLQGLSKYFGVSSIFTYVFEFFPVEIFRLFYPVVIYSFTQLEYPNDEVGQKRILLTVFCVCNIGFFSLIGHKEARFMLPVVPFIFLLTAKSCVNLVQRYKWFTFFWLRLYMIVEVVIFAYRANFHDQF